MKYYFISVLLFLLIYSFNSVIGIGSMFQCAFHQLYFQKILGYRPLLTTERLNVNNLLYRDIEHQIPSAINIKCWEICKQDYDCSGYILFINSSECYGFTINEKSKRYYILTNSTLVQDQNAIYFEKICLKNVPIMCKKNLWVITKIPGSNLVFQGKKTIPNLVTKENCTEQCLNENEFKCLSASFITSHQNNYVRNTYPLRRTDNTKIYGVCTLSAKDKSTKPDAFRIVNNDEEYIENQCIERVTENDKCSYEVYVNSMLEYAEIEFFGLTEKQCKEKCSEQTQFFCQGITYYDPKQGIKFTKCYLHSEDIVSLGSHHLKAKDNYLYMKRVKCLNVTVTCTSSEMIVNYLPQDWFLGRIYVNSHSDICSSQGKGSNQITLRLPIGNDAREKRCGLIRAYEFNRSINSNRTLISTLLIIQTNPIVQTQGDRLIKVGCVFNDNINDTNIDDIALESAIEFSNRSSPNIGSILINATDSLPNVFMQIINLDERIQTNDVSLGQNLELQIIVEPPNSIYDVRAVQLIARSDTGHNSILLLDRRGCPTDLTIFPTLDKYQTDKIHIMRARFRAFKFTGSSSVNFDVLIHFCLHECPIIRCNRNVISYGKRKKRNIIMNNNINKKSIVNGLPPIIFSENEMLQQQHTDQQQQQQQQQQKTLIVFAPDPIIFNENKLRTSRSTIDESDDDDNKKLYYSIENSANNNNNNNNDNNDNNNNEDNNNLIDNNDKYNENEFNNIISQRIISNVVRDDMGYVENASIRETTRKTINKRILKEVLDRPLQIKLNVREPPHVNERESLIYGENNHILVAGIESTMDSNSICINQTLLIFLILFWILIQFVILLCCYICIRKYKKLAKINDSNNDCNDSINDIHQSLEYDNRKVRWADQGTSHVIIYA